VAVTAQPRLATYTVLIDWGAGTDVDTSEFNDVGPYYLNAPGLVVDGLGRDQTRAYAPPKAPAFDLVLTNEDGRFSPGGPLANFLGRGPTVTVDGTWGQDVLADATDINVDNAIVLVNGLEPLRMFTGIVDDMPQAISRPDRTVAVRALGRLSTLTDKKPTTILYENIRTDQAIGYLLDAVEWPADARSLDTGDTILLYWWLNGNTTALAALNALLAAEGAGGCAYEDRDGTFHFEGRQFRENNLRSLTTQWVFYDGSTPPLDETLPANPLFHIIPAEYRSNPDEVVKTVKATVNVRTPTSVQKIWEFGTTLTLTNNEVRDIEVTSSDPFKSAVTPVAATDYTVTVGSLVSVALLSTSGQTVTLRFTAGASGATVLGVTSNGPQVRAVSLPVTTELPVVSTVDTSVSAARTRPKEPYELPLWPELAYNETLDLVNSMALRYQRERRQIVFRVTNLDGPHISAMLHARISDKVRFIHTHAMLNETYWIEQIHHEVTPGGGQHVVTFGCERTFDVTGGQYDSALYGTAVYGS
jgi:hypothetical protein